MSQQHRTHRVIPCRGERLSIRVDADTLLAVPPMHRATPPATRQQVFSYVLRRQYGLAASIAEDARSAIEQRGRRRAMLAQLMAETPHRNVRGFGLAA